MKRSKREFRLLIGMLAMAIVCWSQTGTGRIQGTVRDSSAAVVPGATVSALRAATNVRYTTQTNDVGFYLFPSVPSGEYRISVESSGMQIWSGTLTLRAGESAAVDAALVLAGTATSVEVKGNAAPLVNTANATVASVLERERIDQLPLNGRNVVNLLLLTTPGLESGQGARVWGLRYASEVLQDGAVLQNREYGTLPSRLPGLDTVSEFRAETANSSAKMNRPGTLIMVTRSGTNELHGSLFETNRNSAMGVARERDQYFTKAPHLVRNEFGGALGGPVFLPMLYNGKNKTFFFFSFEGYRQRKVNSRQTSVPTQAMRDGDFSGLVDGAGHKYTIYDPWSTDASWGRTPFAGNKIPADRLSPLAKSLYAITPLPTREDNPLVASNFYGPGFNNTNQHTETIKIDHRLSDRDQLAFRYSHNPSSGAVTSNPYSLAPTTLDGRANAYVSVGANDSGTANWNHMFSPTFFTETLVAISDNLLDQAPIANYEISSTLGLPNPFKGRGFPRIPWSISSSTSGGMSYDSAINPATNRNRIYSIDQNFTKIHGRHELQFGGRARYESLDNQEDMQVQQGQFNFNSEGNSGLYDPTSGYSYSRVPYTGHTAANFYMGLGSYEARFNRSAIKLRNSELAGYFQDNFKVTPRLTLNLGVRYEYNTPINSTDDSLLSFDKKNKKVILGKSIAELASLNVVLPAIANSYSTLGVQYETRQEAGLPSSMVYKNPWDFGPRLGFAYRLGSGHHTTVVRGGYGIYTYPENLRNFQSWTTKSLPSLGNISNDTNQAAQSPDGLPNYQLRSVPEIIAGKNSSNALGSAQVTGITRGSGWTYYMDPHQPTARAHQWSFLLERELLATTSFKTGFVGTHGARLGQWVSFNDNPSTYVWYATTGTALPTGAYSAVAMRPYDREVYGTMQEFRKSGLSNNVSFQADLERRYAKGYAFHLFYVMSNAMRAGGNGSDDYLYGTNLYLPGTVPEDDGARNRLLNYRRDTSIPKHRVNWDVLVDLPFGKGKLLGRNAGGVLDRLIGGWQIAVQGQLYSRYFGLGTGRIANTRKVEYYGKKYPIQDCTSGVCYDGWLMWNGYIPANRINSYGANGKPNGIMGVPASYKPFATPLHPMPADGGNRSDEWYGYYDSNKVWVTLKDGTRQRVDYAGYLDPMQNQYMLGPALWNMSASLFKTVKLNERVTMRINADFLENVFNMPGTNLPGTNGVSTNKSSPNYARLLQLSARLSF